MPDEHLDISASQRARRRVGAPGRERRHVLVQFGWAHPSRAIDAVAEHELRVLAMTTQSKEIDPLLRQSAGWCCSGMWCTASERPRLERGAELRAEVADRAVEDRFVPVHVAAWSIQGHCSSLRRQFVAFSVISTAPAELRMMPSALMRRGLVEWSRSVCTALLL
ncbi:hypothetical protein [Streptomyces sp. NPDC057253]|uniref:hypothetical protein n=1 Tax=Streptomyces sp. NPDC057253 TaxID=3346069 RepID=UPI003627597D